VPLAAIVTLVTLLPPEQRTPEHYSTTFGRWIKIGQARSGRLFSVWS
jgi:hypothetical protein